MNDRASTRFTKSGTKGESEGGMLELGMYGVAGCNLDLHEGICDGGARIDHETSECRSFV